MRPADHLYSELASLKNKSAVPTAAADQIANEAQRVFLRSAAPIIGESVCGELFSWWLERDGGSRDLTALGHIAAFLVDGYDPSQTLVKADWLAIKDAVGAEAEEMDLHTLSRIMTDLVDRGALDE